MSNTQTNIRPMLGPAFTVVPEPGTPDLRRQIAVHALARNPHWVAGADYYEAARIMGRELHEETRHALSALTPTHYDKLSPELIAWCKEVRAAILA